MKSAQQGVGSGVAAIVRARRMNEEDGMTVLEVIIATAILSIVVAFVMTGFSSFQSAATTDDLKLQNLDEARLLMATLTKDIRTATLLQSGTSPFTIADVTHMQFYGNLMTTSDPNQVEIYIDTTNPNTPYLVEKMTTPDPGTGGTSGFPPAYTGRGTTTTRFVGKYVVNDSSNPLFTYFDSNGHQLIPPTGQTALSAAQLIKVNSIGINLSVRKSTSRAVPPTTLISSVTLPNIYYNVGPSPTPT